MILRPCAAKAASTYSNPNRMSREVGIINPTWLLVHEVEHESHTKCFIMVALSYPLVVDILHQPLEIWLCVF
jgi:hypothetical protein